MPGSGLSDARFSVGFLVGNKVAQSISDVVPNFSWLIALEYIWSFQKNSCSILEPIGSVSPKVNLADELNVLRSPALKTLSLLCPAQAYPTPVFR